MKEGEEANMGKLNSYFEEELNRMGRDGIMGVASFANVYGELMPVQKKRLKEVCGSKLENLIRSGSIICIGIAYSEHAIDSINVVTDGTTDRDRWNLYAREYREINKYLNTITKKMAETFYGIPIEATLTGLVDKVENVRDYYPLTISHRVVAENAGLGWRGKNELVVNEKYACAVRFASVVTEVELPHGKKQYSRCGDCSACLEACAILRNKDKVDDFRESCRRFIRSLGLADEVCGKCIAACYRQSLFKRRFKLRRY